MIVDVTSRSDSRPFSDNLNLPGQRPLNRFIETTTPRGRPRGHQPPKIQLAYDSNVTEAFQADDNHDTETPEHYKTS